MADRRRQIRIPIDKGALEKDGSLDDKHGPRYLIVDQNWKMSDFPDPLAPKPNMTAMCPPGMSKDQESRLWDQLQKYKETAKKLDK
ncbi:hypothetical protein SAPIO_CDS3552 [Scedosporium apiospermum]|uniref:Uncharacterized protein n=1 Tax=Pseudallescheria apiosperma TaxID=563466 RepID=A0A084GB19_PSEDA|nr:uncharacterized protein SAPIO_CDS3552 [Scedosporium apiospermum]KEZ44531.1 hypothetical protein SAPIO_CDS3552 [Scedosporium apiospermum]